MWPCNALPPSLPLLHHGAVNEGVPATSGTTIKLRSHYEGCAGGGGGEGEGGGGGGLNQACHLIKLFHSGTCS